MFIIVIIIIIIIFHLFIHVFLHCIFHPCYFIHIIIHYYYYYYLLYTLTFVKLTHYLVGYSMYILVKYINLMVFSTNLNNVFNFINHQKQFFFVSLLCHN